MSKARMWMGCVWCVLREDDKLSGDEKKEREMCPKRVVRVLQILGGGGMKYRVNEMYIGVLSPYGKFFVRAYNNYMFFAL